MTTPTTVDAYIAAARPEARQTLTAMRQIILDAVPTAVESIKYGMPSYAFRGRPLVHFSAAKAHVGVYGLVHVEGDVPAALAQYLDHRSTLRFKFDEPLPSAALAETLGGRVAAIGGG